MATYVGEPNLFCVYKLHYRHIRADKRKSHGFEGRRRREQNKLWFFNCAIRMSPWGSPEESVTVIHTQTEKSPHYSRLFLDVHSLP